jgi:lipoprotein NlpD
MSGAIRTLGHLTRRLLSMEVERRGSSFPLPDSVGGGRGGGWLAAGLTALPIVLLSGCPSVPPQAPVEDRTPQPPMAPPPQASKAPPAQPVKEAKPREAEIQPEVYVVKKGDTLTGIAMEHGVGYRDLAEWNGIPDPYVIRPGQQLLLGPRSGIGTTTAPWALPPSVAGRPIEEATRPSAGALVKTEPKALKLPYSESALATLNNQAIVPRSPDVTKPKPAEPEPKQESKVAPGQEDDHLQWGWPASGTILSAFSEGGKGLDIAGKQGQPVFASADGKVIYSGAGLRGYGKLIIIKHNDIYMSAYAHNSELIVKEGQAVAKGQKIAEMGSSDADRVKLHFEIRLRGKPVDPLKYLPAERAS